ncbi:hypothetical protein RHSIM_Rhsim01G0095700 [Rhododendron simsii]|uniref:non-specific serine/threonine protein kinase n=1 Tax=Rhododendron simsii TaxID=118357 RepID=A0A834LWQ2_RHOSS|nr:hypothetical protein RHSIM_Rhsim01G0095700 [Rhododendron simsii]
MTNADGSLGRYMGGVSEATIIEEGISFKELVVKVCSRMDMSPYGKSLFYSTSMDKSKHFRVRDADDVSMMFYLNEDEVDIFVEEETIANTPKECPTVPSRATSPRRHTSTRRVSSTTSPPPPPTTSPPPPAATSPPPSANPTKSAPHASSPPPPPATVSTPPSSSSTITPSSSSQSEFIVYLVTPADDHVSTLVYKEMVYDFAECWRNPYIVVCITCLNKSIDHDSLTLLLLVLVYPLLVCFKLLDLDPFVYDRKIDNIMSRHQARDSHAVTILPKPSLPPGVVSWPLLPPPPPPFMCFPKSTFTYKELAMATDDFSNANLLGQGGVGCVHKGVVLPNGEEVAVKQLKAGSAGRPPDQYGGKNPSPTWKMLSTNGQTEMENQMVGHLEETNEFLLDFVEYPNGRNTENASMILGENMGSLGDRRNSFCSLEEHLQQGHISGSMWTVPPCSNPASSQHIPTIPPTMGSSEDRINSLAFLEDVLLEEDVSGSISWTIPLCQLMPTVPRTTGSSDDLRNLLPSGFSGRVFFGRTYLWIY